MLCYFLSFGSKVQMRVFAVFLVLSSGVLSLKYGMAGVHVLPEPGPTLKCSGKFRYRNEPSCGLPTAGIDSINPISETPHSGQPPWISPKLRIIRWSRVEPESGEPTDAAVLLSPPQMCFLTNWGASHNHICFLSQE